MHWLVSGHLYVSLVTEIGSEALGNRLYRTCYMHCHWLPGVRTSHPHIDVAQIILSESAQKASHTLHGIVIAEAKTRLIRSDKILS